MDMDRLILIVEKETVGKKMNGKGDKRRCMGRSIECFFERKRERYVRKEAHASWMHAVKLFTAITTLTNNTRESRPIDIAAIPTARNKYMYLVHKHKRPRKEKEREREKKTQNNKKVKYEHNTHSGLN